MAIDADSSSDPATCRARSRSARGTGVCRMTSARRAMVKSRGNTRATLTLRPGSDQIFTVLYRAPRARQLQVDTGRRQLAARLDGVWSCRGCADEFDAG